MEPFLKIVTDDLYTRLNGNFEGVAMVFPNKRAGLFFNEYLLGKIGNGAAWSPACITISELFEDCSESIIADSVLLVSKLHKVYMKHTGSNESLDKFYYWGEMLIKDFDDVDKNLANAQQLFANIEDLHKLGTAKDILDDEQQKAVQQFFTNFAPEKKSELKEKFKNTWEVLYPIYTSFKELLKKEHLAYEGMLYRDVIEKKEGLSFAYDKYVFVGFNALNGAERELFNIIKKEGKALFYWDYDKHYTLNPQHEAGHFMRMNLQRYPNAIEEDIFNNLAKEKRVTFVSASTDNIQTRYIPQWLNENMSEKEIETAIVLCDETMLESVLHTLPKEANGRKLEHLNVTMGFPISHTPVFSLVKLLVELQTRGYDKRQERFTLTAVERILKHPYIIQSSPNAMKLREKLLNEKRFFPATEELCCDDILSLAFAHPENNSKWMSNIAALIYSIANSRTEMGDIEQDLYEELFCEALLKAHNQTQRLLALLENGDIELQQSSLGSLLLRIISQQSMPFHGEPVVGLQIMGLLETRNLDFKNVIILAASEGNLPKNSNDNSFIPYNLRRAFGLTMSEHRDSIYAYYFYRLLQRAENITVVYNNSTESKSKGECSRYLLQILGENLYHVKRLHLEAEQTNVDIEPKAVEKSDAVMQVLNEKFNQNTSSCAYTLSPSGINKYLECELKFFYYYAMGLKEFDEVSTELEANDFGDIFHLAAELMYAEITTRGNGTIEKSDLQRYEDNPLLLLKHIEAAYEELFFKKGNKPVYNGEQLINKRVMLRFMQRLIKMDKAHTPFTSIGGEKRVQFPYSFKNCEGKNYTINIGGKIDRIDAKGNTLNIIDYKTGRDKLQDKKNSIDEIFAHEGDSAGYRFQALLYAIAVIEQLNDGKNYGNDKDYSWIEKVKQSNIEKVVPELIYIIRKDDALHEDFVVDINNQPIEDAADLKSDFLARLESVLQDIFNNEKPFTPTDKKERCRYCEYKGICGR
ncbi:MAG: PD-(D/E)XK nuclease family protein [Bacteroidaceae bacterium]|nr:PD-(D/E)XK nuclease family protein [Bacteroidaceae bacterium]